MSSTVKAKAPVKGGSFLIEDVAPSEIFTVEDFSEEQKMIAQTTHDFVVGEVYPAIGEIEHKNFDVIVKLLRKAGELGLLSVDVPEKYGGLGLDKVCSMIVGEKVAINGSFAVTVGGHSGIGSWPIIYFGTEQQKRRYLPKLATGELIAAYALTEPHSGSDALAAKTRAVLSDDGKYYILNGTKMWITNAGFADVFIVFAKVDGEKFSCFIVEKNFPGVSTGKEEHKMGIVGSSTRTLELQDARVPVENLLGEIGRGHVIAFNVLNLGRFKLGAACVGGAKVALKEAISYALERHQFGKPIASFGAIRHKLAEMAIRIYAAESMIYRTAGLIDDAVHSLDPDDSQGILKGIEEFAVECSINKVYGSEMLDYVVDEMVQIYGGYGYSEEYPAARAYRDSRINRIFEGTNEINRMLIPGMLMKRAMKGELPLLQASKKLMDELLSMPMLEEFDDSLLAEERRTVRNAKKVALMISGLAAQKYLDKLSEQQELLMGIADIIMETFAMESMLLRTLKYAQTQGEQEARFRIAATRTFVSDSMDKIEIKARNMIAAISEGDTMRTNLAALKRFVKHTPINTIEARQAIAVKLCEVGRYIF
ncbi:MAG: acyl-CoA dehydrogenase family protein [Acidobacteriota bacterium]|nr:acyl-CoA dehydrogenase family protein [Blastocatellia bacterium]MDW8412856.1 acyl-CoA dehydrogenase family protein [Acidobacteriota bacterium]